MAKDELRFILHQCYAPFMFARQPESLRFLASTLNCAFADIMPQPHSEAARQSCAGKNFIQSMYFLHNPSSTMNYTISSQIALITIHHQHGSRISNKHPINSHRSIWGSSRENNISCCRLFLFLFFFFEYTCNYNWRRSIP